MALLFRRRDYVYYSLLANVLTNPAVNLLLFLLAGNLGWPYWPVLGALEITAVMAETWVYRKVCDFRNGLPGWGKAAGLSILLNLLSLGAGCMMNNLQPIIFIH